MSVFLISVVIHTSIQGLKGIQSKMLVSHLEFHGWMGGWIDIHEVLHMVIFIVKKRPVGRFPAATTVAPIH